jgi:hypothetical protein
MEECYYAVSFMLNVIMLSDVVPIVLAPLLIQPQEPTPTLKL